MLADTTSTSRSRSAPPRSSHRSATRSPARGCSSSSPPRRASPPPHRGARSGSRARRRRRRAAPLRAAAQPAEEGPPAGEKGGAKLMLEEGLFADLRPAAVFGLHADSSLTVGQLGYSPEASNASSDSFEITLSGKSAHAAWPHLSVDPILMASQAVMALQTIRARNLSPYEPSVITIAQIHGGVRDNIIPGEVKMSGTVRLFDPEVQNEVERRMREILEGIAKGGSE